MGIRAFTVTSLVLSLLLGALAEQCGQQANGALCPGGLCCSQYGWCGTTDAYCCDGCQSQCNCGGGGGGGGDADCGGDGGGDDDTDGYLDSLIPKSTFEQMLLHRNDPACPAKGFYTYEAFIKAAKAFPDFATQGDDETRKREIAAFFGQTSHETTGGWPDAPDGPYAWGYCFNEEIGCPPYYCDASNLQYPCVSGKTYCGRGPIQLSWNYNYGQCGEALGYDLLSKPECVKKDPVLSFKTAIWFWMTPQAPKPSCHDVITGEWVPSNGDLSAGRVPGYGAITNIINGGLECGIGKDSRVDDRIGFYKRYCDLLGIDYGDNLDCSNQRPFGSGLLVNTI